MSVFPSMMCAKWEFGRCETAQKMLYTSPVVTPAAQGFGVCDTRLANVTMPRCHTLMVLNPVYA